MSHFVRTPSPRRRNAEDVDVASLTPTQDLAESRLSTSPNGSPGLLDRIYERKRAALVDLNGTADAPPRRRLRRGDPQENSEEKVSVQRFTLVSRGAPPVKRRQPAQHELLRVPPRDSASLGDEIHVCRCSDCDKHGVRRRLSGRRTCRRDTESHPEYCLLLNLTDRFEEECHRENADLVNEVCCREKSAFFILGPGSTAVGYVAAEVAANRRALSLLLRDHGEVKVDGPSDIVAHILKGQGFLCAGSKEGTDGRPIVAFAREGPSRIEAHLTHLSALHLRRSQCELTWSSWQQQALGLKESILALDLPATRAVVSFRSFPGSSPMIDGETVATGETVPPPRAHKRGKEGPQTTPGQRAPKRGRKSKEAEDMASTATKLELQAEEACLEATTAEKAALEAMERTQTLRAMAEALAKRAETAKAMAQEARQRAERAELATTKEGRDALKVQDKAEKQAAKEAEKARKQAEKEEAAAALGVIKRIGDTIKASMVICKRGGMWEVPPGSVSFKNVKFGVFKELFSRGRCSYVPTNFCNSDASIVVTSKDAAAIFGATKVRGGSMYATFVISSLRANYIPATGQLSISYSTEMGF
eukprot:s1502_g13.t2